MIEKIKNEPLVTAIVVLLAATAGLLAAFGVEITSEQRDAIIAFVVALIVVVALVRSKVTPTRKL